MPIPTRATPPAGSLNDAAIPLTPGARLGPYEIVESIGSGGMGVVYRAHDSRLDRDVAVKVVAAHLASDPEARARFEREARAIAALSHPNILAIHDIGTKATSRTPSPSSFMASPCAPGSPAGPSRGATPSP